MGVFPLPSLLKWIESFKVLWETKELSFSKRWKCSFLKQQKCKSNCMSDITKWSGSTAITFPLHLERSHNRMGSAYPSQAHSTIYYTSHKIKQFSLSYVQKSNEAEKLKEYFFFFWWTRKKAQNSKQYQKIPQYSVFKVIICKTVSLNKIHLK